MTAISGESDPGTGDGGTGEDPPAGGGEDFTPHTVEALTEALGEDYNTEAYGDVLKFANDNQLTIDQVKGAVALSPSLIKPTVHTELTEEVVKQELGNKFQSTEETIKSFTKFANDNKLTKEQIKNFGEYGKSQAIAGAKAAEAAWTTQQDQWKAELEKDSEMTSGAGYADNLSVIAGVVKDYGGEKGEDGFNELQRMLNITGAGNHPAMGRFLLKISKLLPSEGKPAGPGLGTADTTLAQQLFPNKV